MVIEAGKEIKLGRNGDEGGTERGEEGGIQERKEGRQISKAQRH